MEETLVTRFGEGQSHEGYGANSHDSSDSIVLPVTSQSQHRLESKNHLLTQSLPRVVMWLSVVTVLVKPLCLSASLRLKSWRPIASWKEYQVPTTTAAADVFGEDEFGKGAVSNIFIYQRPVGRESIIQG